MTGRQSIVRWLFRLFGRGAAVGTSSSVREASAPVAPLQLPVWAAWADETSTAVPVVAISVRPSALARPLAAQLASQARLNVPSSRKRTGVAMTTKPKRVGAADASAPVAKKVPAARSVHLQARHFAPSRQPMIADRPAAVLATYAGPRGLDLAA